ncbi:MAG: APC family permease [Candidatus Riflebacteria bacterium]|nr:APC family permease [Candidatus Riflebacteria bacterium]
MPDNDLPSPPPAPPSATGPLPSSLTPARALVVGSVMFTFISCWRAACVVLCDIASTCYYIGGIVEQIIGPAAPWFIAAVMLFSYAVRSVYMESCSMFVRGGVYRVVKRAMGSFLAKVSVSALLFDYMLTGPISSVSAGQYLMGLIVDSLALLAPSAYAHLGLGNEAVRDAIKRWGAVTVAVVITLYFFRQNVLGIRESSGKALRIMSATSVVILVVLLWGAVTVAVRGPVNRLQYHPDLSRKVEYEIIKTRDRVTGEPKECWATDPGTGLPVPRRDASATVVPKRNQVTGEQEDPLGFIGRVAPGAAERLRHPASWLGLIGLIGIFVAFGHSILAMSGEETLAQVYREIEAPKLPNLRKAALIVFIVSFVGTVGISFLGVLVVPDEIRVKDYADNLIGGIVMYLMGPPGLRLFLNVLVVVVGALILAGAHNTSIIGANGVLNRVAEDGVMPGWFRKPHPRYGTTHRILGLIVGMQLVTILTSRGNVYVLGEAYAFGVVWCFVFNSLSVLMLRFRDASPREYKVPFNFRIGDREVPAGLLSVFLLLVIAAIANTLTKEIATVGGIAFTLLFLSFFTITERFTTRRQASADSPERLTQFSKTPATGVDRDSLGLARPYCLLVSIRSTQNLFMLEKALATTDPEITDVVVMTAKVVEWVSPLSTEASELDAYDRDLMTAVLDRAEAAGKTVVPVIIPTNSPLYAIARAARDLEANQLAVGLSNLSTAEEQIARLVKEWRAVHAGEEGRAPLTIRVLSDRHDIRYDVDGGNRIPTFAERRARSVAELRWAGVGVRKVLLLHDGSPYGGDLFESVLTALDSEIELSVVRAPTGRRTTVDGESILERDRLLAEHLNRTIRIEAVGADAVQLARNGDYGLIIVPLANKRSEPPEAWVEDILAQAPGRRGLRDLPQVAPAGRLWGPRIDPVLCLIPEPGSVPSRAA